jgi:hypothetical protein
MDRHGGQAILHPGLRRACRGQGGDSSVSLVVIADRYRTGQQWDDSLFVHGLDYHAYIVSVHVQDQAFLLLCRSALPQKPHLAQLIPQLDRQHICLRGIVPERAIGAN